MRQLSEQKARSVSRSGTALLLPIVILAVAGSASAAKEDGCVGGAFSIVTASTVLMGNQNSSLAKASLGTTFSVQGKYVRFDVTSASFAALNYTFNPAATNGQPLVAFASKTPN